MKRHEVTITLHMPDDSTADAHMNVTEQELDFLNRLASWFGFYFTVTVHD